MNKYTEYITQEAEYLSNLFKKSKILNQKSGNQQDGLSGYEKEEILRNFLQKNVRPSIGVNNGKVIDSFGKISGEKDIIIYDKNMNLPYFQSVKLVPIECVIAVIEVKSEINQSSFTKAKKQFKDCSDLKVNVECYNTSSNFKFFKILFGVGGGKDIIEKNIFESEFDIICTIDLAFVNRKVAFILKDKEMNNEMISGSDTEDYLLLSDPNSTGKGLGLEIILSLLSTKSNFESISMVPYLSKKRVQYLKKDVLEKEYEENQKDRKIDEVGNKKKRIDSLKKEIEKKTREMEDLEKSLNE